MAAAVAVVLVAGGCEADDAASQHTNPALTQAVTLGGLSLVYDGAFAAWEQERRSVGVQVVKDISADVLCLNQVMRDEDKKAIADGVKEVFPYSFWRATDLDTVPDDARDVHGQVPAELQSAPCEDADLQSKTDNWLACATQSCSTEPGSMQGKLNRGSCLAEKCVSTAVVLLYGDQPSKRCYSCLLYSLMSETLADTRDLCVHNPKAGFTFKGANGQLILSRFPLSNERAWILPSTAWREILLSATVQLPSGASFDAHCLTLQGPHAGSTQPYIGLYGDGKTDDTGWTNETLLQAQRVIERVRADTPSGQGVVFGDMYVGPAFNDLDSGVELQGATDQAYQQLTAQFREALAPGFQPACTVCGDNPMNLGATNKPGSWTVHALTTGLGAPQVNDTSRFGMETVVDVTDGSQPPKTVRIPVSPRYGMKSTIVLGGGS